MHTVTGGLSVNETIFVILVVSGIFHIPLIFVVFFNSLHWKVL